MKNNKLEKGKEIRQSQVTQIAFSLNLQLQHGTEKKYTLYSVYIISRISTHRSCQIDPTLWLLKHAMHPQNMPKFQVPPSLGHLSFPQASTPTWPLLFSSSPTPFAHQLPRFNIFLVWYQSDRQQASHNMKVCSIHTFY